MTFESAGYPLQPVLPELVLAVGAMVLLMVGAYRGQGTTRLVTGLAVCLLVLTGVLETGELRMQYVEGDMNVCLSEVCRHWSGRFQERGLALYFLANDKLMPFAFDAPKIQRVISNLLDNASKYTPQGGTVWLHAEPHMWERRSVSKSGANGDRRRQAANLPNAIKVSVADTGPGIRPEYHMEIFDDFFRLPGSESAEGMGLGLAIARRLLQGMGGKIWVESEPGAGCKFSFLVPLKPILSSPPRGTQ